MTPENAKILNKLFQRAFELDEKYGHDASVVAELGEPQSRRTPTRQAPIRGSMTPPPPIPPKA